MQLPKGSTVADIGAGTGNYSGALIDQGYRVISVEPEKQMRDNSLRTDLSWVASAAEQIELPDHSVDGITAINCVHHFSNLRQALREFDRILKDGPMILFTFDPSVSVRMWLFDYWPSLRAVEEAAYLPVDQLCGQIEEVFGKQPDVLPFLLPRDFSDVFSAALWSRPQLLFDSNTIKASSLLSSLDPSALQEGLEQLRIDLDTGRFAQKYPALAQCQAYDAGCRLLVVRKG